MHVININSMDGIPESWKERIRELSYGPLASGWSSWSWTFHDGSCWVACLFNGPEQLPHQMIAWAIVTKEIDHAPVIGAWVESDHRGMGFAVMVVSSLLRSMMAAGTLEENQEIFAATGLWSKYFQVMTDCGLRCVEWV